AQEGGKVEVRHAHFIPVLFEIVPEQGQGLAVEGFHVLETPGARNLLRKNAVQLRVDAVCLDRYSNQLAHRLLQWLRSHFSERGSLRLNDFMVVTLDDSGNRTLFDGELLVDRADAHARCCSDAVGAGLLELLCHQNASSRLDESVHRCPRSLLSGVFPEFRERAACHVSWVPDASTKCESSLIFYSRGRQTNTCDCSSKQHGLSRRK